ncbi:DUF523 domain-containing protein [Ochrobactrum sp. MR28]|nr:DUF523 domain-containing protein [Ochrobactrum sp. MR28]MBX8816996.1 DUF523 domain-containing protein [Ochrobactrum sp. MR31]
MTAKILVSACLLGKPVRYNGSDKKSGHPALEQWVREERVISVCPELTAGFSIPRPPAEIANGFSGNDVLSENARVVEITGRDVTELYVEGARATLAVALENGCKYALLTDGSPSCGSAFIYDGAFAGNKHNAAGVTSALLLQHGIEVFSEAQIPALQERLSAEQAGMK